MRDPIVYPWRTPKALARGARSTRDWRRVYRHCLRRALAWELVALNAESVDPERRGAERYALAAAENWKNVAGNALHLREIARTGRCGCKTHVQ
jgi:hypothetical protein